MTIELANEINFVAIGSCYKTKHPLELLVDAYSPNETIELCSGDFRKKSLCHGRLLGKCTKHHYQLANQLEFVELVRGSAGPPECRWCGDAE